MDEGYTNITVLDISQNAIQKAKDRLGDKGSKVKWIVSDVLNFSTQEKYSFWHDRSAFHFLINVEQVGIYQNQCTNSIKSGGHLVLATFSETGPKKCSELEIVQYSASSIDYVFSSSFELKESLFNDRQTPFGTTQNFIYTFLESAI